MSKSKPTICIFRLKRNVLLTQATEYVDVRQIVLPVVNTIVDTYLEQWSNSLHYEVPFPNTDMATEDLFFLCHRSFTLQFIYGIRAYHQLMNVEKYLVCHPSWIRCVVNGKRRIQGERLTTKFWHRKRGGARVDCNLLQRKWPDVQKKDETKEYGMYKLYFHFVEVCHWPEREASEKYLNKNGLLFI